MLLSSERLKAFAVFAHNLNFTHAARELGVSQPALHVAVHKLAEELGVVLYRRVGRKLELTRDGVRVLAYARQRLARDAEFMAHVAGRDALAQVTLAAGEGSFLYLLGDAVRHFRKSSAGPLRLLTRDQDQALSALLSGEADLGVAAFGATHRDLIFEPLTRVSQALVMPRGHRLARKRRLCLSDLAGEALVVPPEGRPHRQLLARTLSDQGVDWQVAVEASGWELMLEFVSLGLGLAVVNGCVRLPANCVGRTLGELPSVAFQLAYRRDATPGPRTLALRDALIRYRDSWQHGAARRAAGSLRNRR